MGAMVVQAMQQVVEDMLQRLVSVHEVGNACASERLGRRVYPFALMLASPLSGVLACGSNRVRSHSIEDGSFGCLSMLLQAHATGTLPELLRRTTFHLRKCFYNAVVRFGLDQVACPVGKGFFA